MRPSRSYISCRCSDSITLHVLILRPLQCQRHIHFGLVHSLRLDSNLLVYSCRVSVFILQCLLRRIRDYFWATAALYASSWLVRYIRTFFNGTSDATFEELPENMVKITIPTEVSWKPGQHFFVRFLDLGVHAATSHPFTVASLPDAKTVSKGGVVEMYARVHGGVTARLGAIARNGTMKASKVLLDGPYGGVEGNLKAYDRVLLLSGGSGACVSVSGTFAPQAYRSTCTGVTFVVPLLLDLVRSYEAGKTRCRKVHLVWAVRTAGALILQCLAFSSCILTSAPRCSFVVRTCRYGRDSDRARWSFCDCLLLRHREPFFRGPRRFRRER